MPEIEGSRDFHIRPINNRWQLRPLSVRDDVQQAEDWVCRPWSYGWWNGQESGEERIRCGGI